MKILSTLSLLISVAFGGFCLGMALRRYSIAYHDLIALNYGTPTLGNTVKFMLRKRRGKHATNAN